MERAANLAFTDLVPALLAATRSSQPSEITPLAVRRAGEAMNRGPAALLLQTVIGAGETGAGWSNPRHELRHRSPATGAR